MATNPQRRVAVTAEALAQIRAAMPSVPDHADNYTAGDYHVYDLPHIVELFATQPSASSARFSPT